MGEESRELIWKAHREGDLQVAETGYLGLLAKSPAVDDAINLGALLRKQGRLREAAEFYGQWLPKFRDELQLHLNAANCLHELNQQENCLILLGDYLQRHPEASKISWALARSLTELRKYTEAEILLRRLTKEDPNSVENWMELGVNLHKQEKKEEALTCFEEVNRLNPQHAISISNRITMLKDAGRFQDCKKLIEELGVEMREDSMVRGAIATMYMAQNNVNAAAKELKLLCTVEPNQAGHWLNLAANLRSMKQCNAALIVLKRGICRQPKNADLNQALGQCLAELGYTKQALPVLLSSAGEMGKIKDDHLFNIQFLGAGYHLILPAALEEWAKTWEERKLKEANIGMLWADVIRTPVKNRKIRVGYLSADWSNHPVCRFMMPILKNHDRKQVEIWGICSSHHRDIGNEIAKQNCDHWLDILHASDLEAARIISDLKLDVLVELGGYTGYSRISALIYKAAPVQLSYLGYFAPTYLNAIDGWIGDNTLFAGLNEVDKTAHKLWNIKGGYMAYESQIKLPSIGDIDRKIFRFGSFNHSRKLNPESIALYARVLQKVPNSELALKSVSFIEAAERKRITEALEKAGIQKERLILLDTTETSEKHLELYEEMDVALDPFPYGGATTSCEALVMGVPVVTLSGEGMVRQLSSSILASAGLNKLIATNEIDYIEIANTFANKGVRNKKNRNKLRAKVLSSPLCDGKRLSNELERIYRDAYCAKALM